MEGDRNRYLETTWEATVALGREMMGSTVGWYREKEREGWAQEIFRWKTVLDRLLLTSCMT